NSNWRGPIWFPINFLLVESLREFHGYYGDEFRIECPVGSGRQMTLGQAADELARRLTGIFKAGPDGRRPVHGQYPDMQADPHFRDHLLFYEYFHGDTGRGVGASHQTGWTGLVANLLQPRETRR
ncbi:MAG: glucosidase, partial [Rhodospirillaceae bacterium]|nr:glucosidase [Rhodospirillaceae bacterium]